MRLKGKSALITGAGSGIGRATAIRFAAEGAMVTAADISEAAAVETVAAIREAGGEATAAGGDVAQDGDAKGMVQAAIDAYGRLDVVVNSAGISARSALPEGASHEAVWDKVMDVNLKGTYLVSWHAVPEMERSGSGSIINLASIMALVGYPVGMGGGFNPYNASKAACCNSRETLRLTMASKGIRVNCICPGYVETNMTQALTGNPDSYAALKGRHPLGRLGSRMTLPTPRCSWRLDEAAFVTGAPLIVDGGYTAQ